MSKQQSISKIKDYLDKKQIKYKENHYFKMGLRPYAFYLTDYNTCLDLEVDYTDSKLFYCSDNIIGYIKINSYKSISKQIGNINTCKSK